MKKLVVLALCISLMLGISSKRASAEPIIGAIVVGGFGVAAIIDYFVIKHKEAEVKVEHDKFVDKVKKSSIIINSKKYDVEEMMGYISNNIQWTGISSDRKYLTGS
jgi:hypothetical protein